MEVPTTRPPLLLPQQFIWAPSWSITEHFSKRDLLSTPLLLKQRRRRMPKFLITALAISNSLRLTLSVYELFKNRQCRLPKFSLSVLSIIELCKSRTDDYQTFRFLYCRILNFFTAEQVNYRIFSGLELLSTFLLFKIRSRHLPNFSDFRTSLIPNNEEISVLFSYYSQELQGEFLKLVRKDPPP